MKKFLKSLPIIILSCILIAGVIGLIVPFDFENYSYSEVNSNSKYLSNSYNINFEIENDSDKDIGNVTILITYNTRTSSGIKTENVKLENMFLKKGDNKISFSHNSETSSTFKEISSIQLMINEEKPFTIYSGPTIFSGVNWTFITMIIISFFGLVIVNAINKSRKKEEEINEGNRKTLNERIREAFTPVADTINTIKKTYEDSQKRINNQNETDEKPVKKITCPYCKGKYASTEDKCPHCGAPPEPSD